jgi:hypothetical protein
MYSDSDRGMQIELRPAAEGVGFVVSYGCLGTNDCIVLCSFIAGITQFSSATRQWSVHINADATR